MIPGVLTLAGLTIREAVRRRVFLAAVVISLLYIGFAFLPLHIRPNPFIGLDMEMAKNNTGRIFAWLGCGTIKFFGAILAVALSAGAITAEVDRGVLSVIVPKPIPRAAVYLGKWLGIVTLLTICVAGWGVLLAWAIWHQTGTYHPLIWGGIAAAWLFPVLFTTLTLCFSTFATYALSSSLSLIAAGVALAEDLLHTLSRVLNIETLDTLSKIASYIVPLGRMNHWISRGLDATGPGGAPPGSAGLDFSLVFSQRDPTQAASVLATSTGDMVYILAYMAAFFVLGLVLFQRRDL
jgi:ABC-type transport system involved in multi-copper enzyme maturation permease subunit